MCARRSRSRAAKTNLRHRLLELNWEKQFAQTPFHFLFDFCFLLNVLFFILFSIPSYIALCVCVSRRRTIFSQSGEFRPCRSPA